MKNSQLTSVLVCSAALTACASGGSIPPAESSQRYEPVSNPSFDAIADASTLVDKDRLAILAMQGDYRVDFHFSETVPLKRGYETRDDKTTGGYETVFVVEDTPTKIVLQHLLVTPAGHVIKHWRQDWAYEASERFEFVEDQTWEVRRLEPDETRAAWTQCVFEVSDAPRYCGTGRWNHRYGVSTWTSDRTWRPLPRREYTVRSDYNAMNAENRHTITPAGWTHEQDNTKTLRDGRNTQETLVREFGFNDYRAIEGFDFSPAASYWRETAAYWARVRDAWSGRLAPGNTLALKTEIDGMPIITGTFALAERASETTAVQQLHAIEALLNEWTDTAGADALARR